jgi:Zn-finger nucleic acid-binding protein
MDCFRCHTRMVKTDKEGVLVDRCNECGGIWLDAGELDALERGKGRKKSELARAARAEIAREAGDLFHIVGMCPKCHADHMQAVKKKGVELDYCPKCHGMYFDDTELEAVRRGESGGFVEVLFTLFRKESD